MMPSYGIVKGEYCRNAQREHREHRAIIKAIGDNDRKRLVELCAHDSTSRLRPTCRPTACGSPRSVQVPSTAFSITAAPHCLLTAAGSKTPSATNLPFSYRLEKLQRYGVGTPRRR